MKRGRPFPVGNRFGKGRPKGSCNRATRMVQQIFNEHSRALAHKCVLDAMHGKPHAMKLCMERLMAPRRESYVDFRLPSTQSPTEIGTALDQILQGATAGQLTPEAARQLCIMLEKRAKIVADVEFEQRLTALEQQKYESEREEAA